MQTLPPGPRVDSDAHNSVRAAFLAGKAVERHGGVILFLGYGSAMNAADALRTLDHRLKDRRWQSFRTEGQGEVLRYLDPVPVNVTGVERILTASDAMIQPPPPQPARLWLYRDRPDPDGPVLDAYRGVMAVLGVRSTNRAGASIDATVQAINSEELASRASQEKTYRMRWIDRDRVTGIPPTIDGKPVFIVYSEPLPEALRTFRSRQRHFRTAGAPSNENLQIMMSQGYRDTTLRAVATLLEQTSALGLQWDPTAEIQKLVTPGPPTDLDTPDGLINTSIAPLDADLLALVEEIGPKELWEYAKEISTPEGQLARSMQVPLRDYLKMGAYDLYAQGVNVPELQGHAGMGTRALELIRN